MNINELGYFIYMSEQEERKQQELIEVNVNSDSDFMGELAPSKEDQDTDLDFSQNTRPGYWRQTKSG